MQISIAYQGGGAKLFDLLAAVQASKTLEERNSDYNVFRVSGASAGAVAAAMHALDADIEQVISKSTEFDALLTKHFPIKRVKPLRVLYRLFQKKAIFDESSVHDVLTSLFNNAGINASRTISDLMKGRNKQIRIVSSDILGLTRPVHDENSPVPLVDALVDSCAIPFAFRLPVKGSAKGNILDGGLFQNLPAREALKDLEPGARALGISFSSPNRRSVEGYNFLKYAGALIDSMISERVEDSASQLGPSNVIKLVTDIDTFAFEPLFKGEVRARFKAKEEQAKGFLENWLDGSIGRDSPDWFSLESHDIIELERITSERALQFYNSLGTPAFHADRASHEIFAQSLLGEEHPDIYTTTLKLSGKKNKGLQFFCFRFYAPVGQQLLQPTVRVEDERGQDRIALMLPMREPGGVRARSVLICLPEPLREDDSITLIKTERAFGAMKRYLAKGWTEETLSIGPGKSAQILEVGAHFPIGRVPKAARDADPQFEVEKEELGREGGTQLLTELTTRQDSARGFVTYRHTTREAAEPSEQKRFIKIFYYNLL